MKTDEQLGDGIATAVAGDVLIVAWRSAATLARWRWFYARCEALIERHPEGVICLDFILSSSTPPDAALRAKMQEDLRRLGPRLRRLVAVPLGDSLWKSIVRTIMRTMMLLSGQSKQQAIVATLDEGVDRVLEVSGPNTPTRAQLRASAEALLRVLGAPETAAARHA